MKLVIAVVQGTDAEALLSALSENHLRATQISSSGGFLRENNVTMLIGVDDDRVADVERIVSATCHSRQRFVNPLMPLADFGEIYAGSPVEVTVGGATLFVLNVRRFARLGVDNAT